MEPAPADGSVTQNMREFDDDPVRSLTSKVSQVDVDSCTAAYAEYADITPGNQNQLEIQGQGPMCQTPTSECE